MSYFQRVYEYMVSVDRYIMPVTLLILSASMLIVLYVYFILFSPTKWWFWYESVVPAKETYSINEPLVFTSNRVVHKELSMSWQDTLRCDLDGDELGFIYFSGYASSGVVRPKAGLYSSSWKYNSLTPHTGATCYLESNISVTLAFNIKKEQTIQSIHFKIESE